MIRSLLFSSRTTATTDCLYKSKDKSLLRRKRGEEQCVFSERQDVGRKDWVGRKIASLSFGPLSLISPTAPPRTRSGRPEVGEGKYPCRLETSSPLMRREVQYLTQIRRLTLLSRHSSLLPVINFCHPDAFRRPHDPLESGLNLDLAFAVHDGIVLVRPL